MIVRRLEPAPTVPDALRSVAGLSHPILFDSAKAGPTGRWSFLSADPIAVIERQSVDIGQTDWIEDLRRWSRAFHDAVEQVSRPAREGEARRSDGKDRSTIARPAASGAGLETCTTIPFVGGLAGLLSYDLGHAFEQLRRPAVDEFTLPALCVGVYDWVIAWDHHEQTCDLIVTGLTDSGDVSAAAASERVEMIEAVLAEGVTHEGLYTFDAIDHASVSHEVPDFPGVVSNFTRSGFEEAVDAVREHIAAGDIFQANLAQRLLAPLTRTPVNQYLELRQVNAAPMAGYFDGGDWQILSASPERFLELSPDGHVETRPIKGTLKRPTRPEADLYTRDALRQSEKDRAENVMIVDLMRNDLSRVCETGSVAVPRLCEIETYETVQHLVSSVTGRLRADLDCWDLVAGTFPGGSITGCPKIRAMDVITSLESVARGPYCGSLFYASANGRFDASILIRTMIQRGGWLQMPVGGGITYASHPRREYRETLIKAEAMVRSLA